MRKIRNLILVVVVTFNLQSCGGVKVLNAWKGDKEAIQSFKEKNILVIARTADNGSRLAFEIEIADRLRSKGLRATESFKKVTKLHPEIEMTEERRKLIQTLLETEGYNGIVITTIKDKQSVTSTSSSGMYSSGVYSSGAYGRGGYGGYYPVHYGGFHNYYSSTYASGSYYSGFGGYIPLSTSTYTTTTYVLESVIYNLDAGKEDQIIAVVTTELDNPKEAYKTAASYVDKIMVALED